MGDKYTGYKLLFSHPQMVEDLLRGFVREDWIELIDFASLEKYNGAFVTDDLKQRFDDEIWKVRWGQKDLYIFILIEFQSEEDCFMAVRVMTYIGLLYQDLIKAKRVKGGDRLPPILPIVLYNGPKPWAKAPLDILDLIDIAPRGLEKYLPRLRYLLIDEITYGNAELEELKSVVSALFLLERQQTPEQVRRIIATLIDWLKAPEQQSLRRAFTVWLGRVLLPGRYPRGSFPEFHDLQEVHAMLSETVKSWPAQWMEKGKIEDAMNMLQDEVPIEKICRYTGLAREKILELAKMKSPDKVMEPTADYGRPTRRKPNKPAKPPKSP